MALFYLKDNDITFPAIATDDDELVAIGGDLSPQRLLQAYRSGIFPWFSSDEQPICWYSLNPRLLLFPQQLHISNSMKKMLKKNIYTVKLDHNFEGLMRLCQQQRWDEGTWITNRMIKAYTHLHQLGHAHSCEVYRGEELVGGFYGLQVGSVFCGESMVSVEPNSSKYALIQFVNYFKGKGLAFIDCQQPTEHMTKMGAVAVSRENFLQLLAQHRDNKEKRGNWSDLFGDFGC